MKWASVPSEYRKVILRDSVRTGRNFSPARNVLSITAPSSTRFSFVRTNAPPLPGLTCWNSTILKTLPSTSMWVPFLNWLVEITDLEASQHAIFVTPCRFKGSCREADLLGMFSSPRQIAAAVFLAVGACVALALAGMQTMAFTDY